jgi:hypothetical protein
MGTQRTPDEIWSALEKEAGAGDEAERAGQGSVEDAIRKLAAAGVDVETEKAEARAVRTEIEREIAAREVASRARARSLRPKGGRARIVWLVAAAVLVASAAAAYAQWAHRHPELPRLAPPAPTTAPPATSPGPSSQLIAADLRRQAFNACDAKRWSACLSLLDQAREVDPAGNADLQVQAARLRAEVGMGAERGTQDDKVARPPEK